MLVDACSRCNVYSAWLREGAWVAPGCEIVVSGTDRGLDHAAPPSTGTEHDLLHVAFRSSTPGRSDDGTEYMFHPLRVSLVKRIPQARRLPQAAAGSITPGRLSLHAYRTLATLFLREDPSRDLSHDLL